jgi:hypothetical protein
MWLHIVTFPPIFPIHYLNEMNIAASLVNAAHVMNGLQIKFYKTTIHTYYFLLIICVINLFIFKQLSIYIYSYIAYPQALRNKSIYKHNDATFNIHIC